jgi:tetratricopeptide (TPR) repeat protein
VSDDIRTLTAELAADPRSLVFLELGEALRQDGRLEPAAKVVVQGLTRYPELPEGHDLYARILADQGDLEGAFDEWDMTLRLDPTHPGAHKGLGFLFFKADDLHSALRHLEKAATYRTEDQQLAAVITRVRARMEREARPMEVAPPQERPAPAPVRASDSTSAPEPEPETESAAEVPALAEAPAPAEGPVSLRGESSQNPLEDDGLLLVDAAGLRLLGSLKGTEGSDTADRVAAELAGVSKEASRAVRLLQLGEWQSLALEASAAHFFLVAPTPDTMLLAIRDPAIPMARVALGAARAIEAARRWLERGS